jgi:DnaK suppressor protein
MNKKLLDELKEKLEKQKSVLEKELSKFAKKDQNLKGDWDTKYPKANGGTGGAALEDAADQVEEYVNLLPVEHDMELRLVDVNSALEKIKKGTYGKCENCGKDIDIERLKVYPEAKFCVKCEKK